MNCLMRSDMQRLENSQITVTIEDYKFSIIENRDSFIRLIVFFTIILTSTVNGFGQIPEKIRNIADSLLLERVGNDNFSKLTFDCRKSGPFIANSVWEICPDTTIKIKRRHHRYFKQLQAQNKIMYYSFEYDFQINNDIHYSVAFRLDTTGLLFTKDNLKLPEFKKTPEYYSNIISKEKAICMADSIGFEKGIGDWQIDFIYNEEQKQFCWEIRALLEKKVYSPNCIDSQGAILIICCTTQEILTGLGWRSQCNN